MSGQLHLLRPFAKWSWRGQKITAVAGADEYVRHVAACGYTTFHTATGRYPLRCNDLKGGSVYFVKGGVAMFRMEFLRIDQEDPRAPRYGGKHLVVMRPKVIPVASSPGVGFVRGWRYMDDADAPPDLEVEPDGAPLPATLRHHFNEAGVLA